MSLVCLRAKIQPKQEKKEHASEPKSVETKRPSRRLLVKLTRERSSKAAHLASSASVCKITSVEVPLDGESLSRGVVWLGVAELAVNRVEVFQL